MLNPDLLKAVILALVISIILGFVLIPFLRRLRFGQNIREDGPKRHLKKSGTPTMGGVIFLSSITITSIVFGKEYNDIYIVLLLTLGCGLIGFIDDYIKVVLKRSLGLTAMQKMLGLILVAVVFTLYIYNFTSTGSTMLVPFSSGFEFDLGALYIPFIVFVIIATVNSVNLTDGLDGLASGITIIVSIFFAIASIIFHNMSLAIFSSIIAASCLGFLVFNIHPAKVFMGDTGALALGGAISAVAIILKMPLFLIIVGGVFVLEALSDIIQVAVYKLSCTRVFRMAPIHHHFELLGWKETKIVTVFWAVSGFFGMIGLLALI